MPRSKAAKAILVDYDIAGSGSSERRGLDIGTALDMQAPWLSPNMLLGAFLLVFVVCALVAQALSTVPASQEGAPIEAFTSGLLWVLSMFGLIKASASLKTGKYLLFWLALTVVTGALAVDEIVGVHEMTEPSFNDDWFKVVMWLATPFVLGIIAKIERAPAIVLVAMTIGYLFHGAYILVETGDGEIFSLGIASSTLKIWEEIFELFFLATYTYALWLLIIDKPSTTQSGDADI